MLIRRSLVALAILATLGGAAGCGQSNTNSAAGTPTSAAAAASPSPTDAGKGNTTQICDQAEKIINADTGKAFGTEIGHMIGAKQTHNATAEAAAKKKIKAQADGWAKSLHALAATATDPAVATALKQTADGVTKLASDAYLAKLTSVKDATKLETDMNTAIGPLSTACA